MFYSLKIYILLQSSLVNDAILQISFRNLWFPSRKCFLDT
ncbi:Uncharacterized protein dnm_037630 [Desulfonema magnum]|uniref:Uncharacterized protein n=1 Tax=Desulfonema magnum TaxID=45655 RepID=A0A975BLE9_9BACT|nr:Uncharacterized protein dnm_037630 [Desulfonema magnum]